MPEEYPKEYLQTIINDSTTLLREELERQLRELPFDEKTLSFPEQPQQKTQHRLRKVVTVRKRVEEERINIENSRLANAIIGKKSEFSREQMDKDWWQKVLPIQRFMKMSRRPFKVETIPIQEQSRSRTPSISVKLLHKSHLPTVRTESHHAQEQRKFRIKFVEPNCEGLFSKNRARNHSIDNRWDIRTQYQNRQEEQNNNNNSMNSQRQEMIRQLNTLCSTGSHHGVNNDDNSNKRKE